MKRVTFSLEGDLEITINACSNEGEASVYVDIAGIDVESDEVRSAQVHGWMAPADAREFARYLNEMADKAEAEVVAQ